MGISGKIYSFLYLRGFKVWVSYRTQTILTVLGWVLPVFTYYFVGTSLGNTLVAEIGVKNYVAFFTIGLAFQGYVSSVISTISQRLRNEQLYGTIEYYVISRTGTLGFLLYSALWGLLLNTVNAVVILTIGYALGANYHINIISTITILFLLIISTLGIGMIAGAVTMITKQGNPISLFFNTFTNLLGGTVFPITALPIVVRYISYGIPLTWALEGLRGSMLQNTPITSMLNIVEILLIFDVIVVPLGVLSYNYAFRKAREKGSLSEY
ncbi:ABC transporter permease [Sulfolobus acidocaldarius]|nr:ABC transporter permease [Sulfolobus acidocaldarius]AGE71714.1 ABC-2 type transporter [Sulfolobus acidocaldarius N8]AGE73987.1 ABC-2 type transporter [Sulfolobus acidocaldarius Ron12/I]ALU30081.1 ABC transporter [Sulfolobus acidocaldarius]ALU30771.1 ABC transporter [Sulfolobus acidocaldarius]WCM35610.1 ABC transporter permease [Sulfolobus acidocaldarius DSM 639]